MLSLSKHRLIAEKDARPSKSALKVETMMLLVSHVDDHNSIAMVKPHTKSLSPKIKP